MMVGREVLFKPIKDDIPAGKVIFELSGVDLKAENGKEVLSDLSIQVRASEVVGIAGVEGNGQFELV